MRVEITGFGKADAYAGGLRYSSDNVKLDEPVSLVGLIGNWEPDIVQNKEAIGESGWFTTEKATVSMEAGTKLFFIHVLVEPIPDES